MDGVVEVAGGFSVDGHDGEMAVVAAAAQIIGGDDVVAFAFAGEGLRFLDDLGRKAVGQMKLADHDFDIDAEIVFLAQNFDDLAARVLSGAGPVGDFYVDDYAFEVLPVGMAGG